MDGARGAHVAFRPDLHLRALNDINVLKGIKLGDFEAGGDRLTYRCAPAQQRRRRAGTEPCSERVADCSSQRAQAELARTGDGVAGSAGPADLEAWGNGKIYGDVLFHGREFQVIETLDGIAEDGISGTCVKGVQRPRSGPAKRGRPDVAALDGGLQMAVL